MPKAHTKFVPVNDANFIAKLHQHIAFNQINYHPQLAGLILSTYGLYNAQHVPIDLNIFEVLHDLQMCICHECYEVIDPEVRSKRKSGRSSSRQCAGNSVSSTIPTRRQKRAHKNMTASDASDSNSSDSDNEHSPSPSTRPLKPPINANHNLTTLHSK